MEIVAAILFQAVQSIAMKKVHTAGVRQSMLVTGGLAGVIAAGFWCCAPFLGIGFHWFTVGMGILYGGLFVATMFCYYSAMQCGPLSYTTFFFSASMLIPSLAGIVLWKEPFTWPVGIGICLFLAAFYLVGVPGGERGQRMSGKWIALCFLCWLGNGCCSLVVKAHQMQMGGRESEELLIAAFSSAALIALLLYGGMRMRSGAAAGGDAALLRRSLGWLVLAAMGNGVGNALVTYLSTRLPGTYLYPMVLGGMLLAVTLYSVFVLKEAISKRGIAGIVIGFAAIVVINIGR